MPHAVKDPQVPAHAGRAGHALQASDRVGHREGGFRTTAFLAAQPDALVCVDQQHHPMLAELRALGDALLAAGAFVVEALSLHNTG